MIKIYLIAYRIWNLDLYDRESIQPMIALMSYARQSIILLDY